MAKKMTYLLILAAAVILIRLINSFSGSFPENWLYTKPGLVDGRFKPCPNKPSCISSQSDPACPCYVKPLKGDWERLREVLKQYPRLVIVEENAKYIRVEAHSLLLNFIDDMEFIRNDIDNTIDVRSSTRIGYYDFGVNRKRLEEIRSQIAN